MRPTRSPRAVWTTTNTRPRESIPSVTKRCSSSASGSSIVTANGSRRACYASAKLTRCLRRFARAFAGSNSMSTSLLCIYYAYSQGPVSGNSRGNCHDVQASSRWYQRLLGCVGGHGGTEYERLWDPKLHSSNWGLDGLILHLHAWDVDHNHGPMGAPSVEVGNSVLLWSKWTISTPQSPARASLARPSCLTCTEIRTPITAICRSATPTAIPWSSRRPTATRRVRESIGRHVGYPLAARRRQPRRYARRPLCGNSGAVA